MSGGSMDYLSYKVEDANIRPTTALRRAFISHLKNVAEALHAIEWNDSGDGHDGEDELIRACLSKGAELTQLITEAREKVDELNEAINKASAE